MESKYFLRAKCIRMSSPFWVDPTTLTNMSQLIIRLALESQCRLDSGTASVYFSMANLDSCDGLAFIYLVFQITHSCASLVRTTTSAAALFPAKFGADHVIELHPGQCA